MSDDTKPCLQLAKTKKCPRGKSCLHVKSHKWPREELLKRSICRHTLGGGTCAHGDSCVWIHPKKKTTVGSSPVNTSSGPLPFSYLAHRRDLMMHSQCAQEQQEGVGDYILNSRVRMPRSNSTSQRQSSAHSQTMYGIRQERLLHERQQVLLLGFSLLVTLDPSSRRSMSLERLRRLQVWRALLVHS